MGLFAFWKKKKELTNIGEIEGQNELYISVWDLVHEKSKYGEKMEKLTEQERVIYVVTSLEGEVNNGGFSQFYYNSSGNVANELVSAFEAILAFRTAKICQKANAVFGSIVPVDRDERNDVLDALFDDHEDVVEILEECDNAFYDYDDDIEKLCYEYILKNKEAFQ